MKTHLPVLDGLRGTAALAIVVFHFQELSLGIGNAEGFWLRHAYLAVDFFFCLSGYVIGYAYDERRSRMGALGFFRARLIRLHPLVVFGILLGLAAYVLDPFNAPIADTQTHAWWQLQDAPLWKLAANIIGGLLMIPSWTLPNRFGCYFSLNAPMWSLMFEYLAYLAYGLLLWRLKRTALVLIVILAATALTVSAYHTKAIIYGFGWGQALQGLARVTFSFSIGLLLFRCGARLSTPLGFTALSIVMILLFLGPFGAWAPFNWLYELAVVLLAFPLIVVLAAGVQTSGRIRKLCDFCGRISYPIYIIHYAFIMPFANYHWTRGFARDALPWAIGIATTLVVAISYLVLVFFDEPIRQWLSNKSERLSLAPLADPVVSERSST